MHQNRFWKPIPRRRLFWPSLFVAGITAGVWLGVGTLIDSNSPHGNENYQPMLGNPAAAYCRSLGYTYGVEIAAEGQTGRCISPEEFDCEAWDFYRGECAAEYSICAREGLQTQIREDGKNPYSTVYAVCVGADGAEVASVDEMSGLNELLSSPGCGDSEERATHAGADEQPVDSNTIPDFIDEFVNGGFTSLAPADLPPGFDWRDHNGTNWLTPVKDQGYCGSCWAFAAAGVAEAAHNIGYADPDLDLDLSEQYLVSDCSSSGDCCGGNKASALQYIRDIGIPDEGCLPYVDGSGCYCGATGCSSECIYSSASACSDRTCSDRCIDYSARLVTISESAYIPATIAGIKQYLVDYGPVAVSMGWGSDYGGYWDENEIYRCSADEGNSSTNHAVVAVGYEDAGQYWIIRNSWGAGWGEGGYFKLGFGECNIERYPVYAAENHPPTPTSTVGPPASAPFYDGFETGMLGQGWSVETSAEGRVQVSSAFPYLGSYSALLDDTTGNTIESTAELILTLDLSTSTQLSLDFWWRGFLDEVHAEDGVFISADSGNTWYKIYSFAGGQGAYTNQVIDLDAASAAFGLVYNDHFKIKFQFRDNYPIPSDGYGIDEVHVYAAAIPPTPTNTASPSPTPTGTNSPVLPTRTPTGTNTPLVATRTPTPTNTKAPTFTATATSTLVPGATSTPSQTTTVTGTLQPSGTPTLSPTPESSSVCLPHEIIACGDQLDGRTDHPGATDQIDSYPCSYWDESGPEYTYQFFAQSNGPVTVTLSNLSVDLDLFVLGETGAGCRAEDCIDYGNDSVTFLALAGEGYYLVVDGYQGAAGGYSLTLDCASELEPTPVVSPSATSEPSEPTATQTQTPAISATPNGNAYRLFLPINFR